MLTPWVARLHGYTRRHGMMVPSSGEVEWELPNPGHFRIGAAESFRRNTISLTEMPQTPHIERHFTAGDRVRDIVIGMSDGLTVPFALAAGLSGAVGHRRVSSSRLDSPRWPRAPLRWGWVAISPRAAMPNIMPASSRAKSRRYGTCPTSRPRKWRRCSPATESPRRRRGTIVAAMRQRPAQWRDFMMRFELGLEAPDPKRALQSALTIAIAYIAGGLIPLSPYRRARVCTDGIEDIGRSSRCSR